MVLTLVKDVLSNRMKIYSQNGVRPEPEWQQKIQNAYKIDAHQLTKYCSDHPVFWYESQHWTPLFLAPNATFWIEHPIDPQDFIENEIPLEADRLGILVTTKDKPESPANMMTSHLFYYQSKTPYRLIRLPFWEETTLNDDGKTTNRVVKSDDENLLNEDANFRVFRDAFFGLFPLTVISSQVDNEHIKVLQKTLRLPHKNLQSKNKTKRKKAQKNTKIRYWEIELPNTDLKNAMMGTRDKEKDENATT